MSGIDTNQAQNTDKNYKETALKVDQWLMLHRGETFDLDLVCKHLNITSPDVRHNVTKKLAYEVTKGILEKVQGGRGVYRYIDTSIRIIDWVNASEAQTLKIQLPRSHEDGSNFEFNDHVTLSPGDVVMVAGVSNTGKTAWALNFLFENMDIYPCTLMGNEYGNGVKFKDRISQMDWAEPRKSNGEPKFELIERRAGWQDIVRPDNINIIDWMMLPDNFYQIGAIIDGIQSKLRQGIAVILIQKDPTKQFGTGGQFSEHLASLYLAMDCNFAINPPFNRLTVVKAKAWNGFNPNLRIYGFELAKKGTSFVNIREVNLCRHCHGSGKVGAHADICQDCMGLGYKEVEYQKVKQ